MTRIFLVLTASALVASCCGNIECDMKTARFHFMYVNQDGVDVLGGPNKKYELSDIKLRGTTGQTVEIEFVYHKWGLTEGQVVFVGEPGTRYFLEVENQVKDTLDFRFRINQSKCCGDQRLVDQVLLNGVEKDLGESGFGTIMIYERN